MIKALMVQAHKHNAIGLARTQKDNIHHTQKRKIYQCAERNAKCHRVTIRKKTRARYHHFPFRHSNAIQHTQDTVQCRDACVVCSENYLLKKTRCIDNDLELPIWDKEVTRTTLTCGGCSTTDYACHLCKKHFKEFHQKTT